MATRQDNKGPCGCCGGEDCCGDGTRQIATDLAGPQSPGCGVLDGNDGYDLAGGASGTSDEGVAIEITGTSQSLQLGIDVSSDVGDYGEWLLGDPSGGPILIEFSPPAGKRVCMAVFSVNGLNFDINDTWTATVTDTGGTLTETGLTVDTSPFNPCALAGSAVTAYAATGESITSIEVSHGVPDDDYIAIGHIRLCLADGTPDVGFVDHDGDYIVDHDGDTITWMAV